MDISKLGDFYKSHRSQTWHFLVLSFIAVCCDILLHHAGDVPHYDTPFIYYLAYAYLILATGIPFILSYFSALLLGILLGILVNTFFVRFDEFTVLMIVLPPVFSAVYLWWVAGVFAAIRAGGSKTLKGLMLRVLPVALLLLGTFFVLWQLGVFNVGEKPAVYLYPEKDMQVKVSLGINGLIIKSIPEYNNGWKVYTTANGRIDNRYDYLFYEVLLFQPEKPQEGWIVEYSELENWFDTKLPDLGLNAKESSDLKAYWLNRLPKSDYYQIGLLSESYLEKNMVLSVTPAPRTVIKRMLYFKPLKTKISLNEPAIEHKERLGFTVVEWGGILDQSIM